MINWILKLLNSKGARNEVRDLKDNIDPNKKENIIKPSNIVTKGELWYPKAYRYEKTMRTRGHYSKGHPRGAIIHFTAGRSRKAPEGGTRALATHKLMGAKSVESCIKDQAYGYFVADHDGGIHQAMPLDRWAYHAGESYWEGFGSGVSDELVGIECQSAGRLEKVKEGVYKAYFTTIEKGDNYFYEHEVRHAKTNNENIQKGIYHRFTEAQEKGLVDLLIWLKHNNPEVFSFDFVLGHDEVAPKRKNDPGFSLSMTMPKFREFLKEEYKRRHE